jgi:predicted RecA/RadA family phage recombinase
MATNIVFEPTDSLSLPVPADTLSGAPVMVGALPGVTLTAEGEGGNPSGFATVSLSRVASIPVTGAVATVGLAIYITSGGVLTATSTDNTLWGYSVATKGSGTAPLRVRPAQV